MLNATLFRFYLILYKINLLHFHVNFSLIYDRWRLSLDSYNVSISIKIHRKALPKKHRIPIGRIDNPIRIRIIIVLMINAIWFYQNIIKIHKLTRILSHTAYTRIWIKRDNCGGRKSERTHIYKSIYPHMSYEAIEILMPSIYQ